METVWLLQDDSDYYGPDFHAVFATEEAARAYIEAWGGEGGILWELDEVPLHHEAPEVFTVHTIVANRVNRGDGAPVEWPSVGRVASRRYSTLDYDISRYPEVTETSYLVRVDALSEDEAKRLFAEAMHRVTSVQGAQ